ncbi:MAG: tetratricopeptide repeat protein [Thermodesulfobacteriota bacterium]
MIFRRVWLAVLLVPLLVGVSWADDCDDLTAPQHAQQRIQACTKAIDSGKWTGNNQAINYNNRGIAWAVTKQYDQAIADFSKAIEINPKYAKAYYNRGISWRRKQQIEKAIADYTKAIELNPNYAKAYGNRAVALALLGRYKEALADAQRGTELDPSRQTKNREILEWIKKKMAGQSGGTGGGTQAPAKNSGDQTPSSNLIR